MNVVASLIEFFIILVSHVAAGIYSSKLKYSKRTTFFIWGIWIVVQSGILFCSEFLTENIAIKFFLGFVLAFLGQYFIFFATTKGRLSQRVFYNAYIFGVFSVLLQPFSLFFGARFRMHRCF